MAMPVSQIWKGYWQRGRRVAKLAYLCEKLDSFCKERLAKHDFLTMTAMYNVLERVRELEWAGDITSPLRGGRRSERSEADPGGGEKLRGHESTPTLHPSPQGGGKTSTSPETAGIEPRIPPLSDSERDIYEAGLIAVLKDIHDEIDRAVFEAYGWRDLGESFRAGGARMGFAEDHARFFVAR